MRRIWLARSSLVAVVGMAAILGSVGPASAEVNARVHTLSNSSPLCGVLLVDAKMFSGPEAPGTLSLWYVVNSIGLSTYNSADIDCFTTVTAHWRNLDTGAAGAMTAEVNAWRFQGPWLRRDHFDIDTGPGRVVVDYTTDAQHIPATGEIFVP
ncbi:MAG: hypothetical protein GX610_02545 [Rhodococcus sp.]|nr:hypothetical protein [Rhodococcus sp. (in: high G+C Gram-positive bacteria)]